MGPKVAWFMTGFEPEMHRTFFLKIFKRDGQFQNDATLASPPYFLQDFGCRVYIHINDIQPIFCSKIMIESMLVDCTQT